jgi:hypothetical protein
MTILGLGAGLQHGPVVASHEPEATTLQFEAFFM